MQQLQKAQPYLSSQQREEMIADLEAEGYSKDSIERVLDDLMRSETWLNDKYQVLKRQVSDNMVWLSIKRLDRSSIHDWRDLQEIKNQLVGTECEGVELYPAEGRKVDTSNQYHLWVVTDPEYRWPFGLQGRAVTYNSGRHYKQRPLE